MVCSHLTASILGGDGGCEALVGSDTMLDAAHQSRAEAAIGHTFRDPRLLEIALTHSSHGSGDNGNGTGSGGSTRTNNNERMEFLGDSVLGLVVCHLLFERFPRMREGDMTKIKSHAVSRETCASIAEQLGLPQLLILGKGMQGKSALPCSLVAAALESVIGAVYLDAGFDCASRFVRPLVEPVVMQAAKSGHQHNFKSVLQQHAQQAWGATPIYRILDEQGPDHAKCFKIGVEIAGRKFESCWGATKKKAEQDAALIALRELSLVEDGPGGDVRVIDPVQS
jgi:ribonuclease III